MMNRRVLRTIYYDMATINNSLGIQYTPEDNTTLNEKYDIATLKYNKQPILSYFSIGLSVKDLVDSSGTMDMSQILHRPFDVDLFRPVPFLVKPKELGITSNELLQYRLIVEKTINNVTYNLFFLKKITNISSNSKMYIVNREDNKDNIELFNPTKYNITNPDPIITEDLYPTIKKFILFNKRIDLTITLDEINNIKNAIELLYPNLSSDIKNNIAEIGLVQGVDETYLDRKELYNAQTAYFISTNNLISQMILESTPIKEIIELNTMHYIPVNQTV